MTIFRDVETRGLEMEVIEATMPYDETDDGNEHLTHIINETDNRHIWRPGMSAQDIVDLARMGGHEIRALCGYIWVPKRNPDKYPACSECIDLAGQIISEDE